MARQREFALLLTAGLLVALIAGCAAPSSTSGTAVSAGEAGAPAALVKTDAALAAPSVVGRDIVKTATAVLAVPDLTASRNAIAAIVEHAGGVITSEIVTSGDSPRPFPMPMMDGFSAGTDLTVPGTGEAIDLMVQVPAANYDTVVRQIRSLGQVVSLQQSATDVTMQVIDTDARIAAARASVARMQTLLDRATNLQDVVLIEQELTTRQANLDSLVAQQKALREQVAASTISVRLVPADSVAVSTGTSAWWNRITATFVAIWSGVVVVLVAVSPVVLLLGLLVWVIIAWRRRRRRPS